MFKRWMSGWRDMGVIRAVCNGAENYARDDGVPAPAAEHFVFAAIDLPDGTARSALMEIGVSPDCLHDALARAHVQALADIGLRVDPRVFESSKSSESALPAPSRLYRSQPSGQRLFQMLLPVRRQHPDAPLTGAHVLMAAAHMPHGLLPRALRLLGVEPDDLLAAAQRRMEPDVAS